MNRYDSVLILNNPKLLSNIITYSQHNEYSINISNIVENSSSYSNKSDMVNKHNYKTVDFNEGKKIKNKKKEKNKVYLNKEVLELKHELKFKDFHQTSLVRNTRNSRSKKIYQDKSISNISDFNSEETISKEIYLDDLLTVQELSAILGVPTTDIIKWLFLQGISATINQVLDTSISTLVAKNYSFNVLKRSVKKTEKINVFKNKQDGILSTPVVTFLGHVDHGKTSLLKTINKDITYVKERGNITQSISAYEVSLNNNHSINKFILLDTPGHEAFIGMRERGADITDIIVLVVAADDGLKPQTIEALDHIRSRNIPFIVAINKVDKPEADVNKVKQQLKEFHVEDTQKDGWTSIIEVSSLTGYNIDNLLKSLVAIAEVYQWKSNPRQLAEGTILEAYLNKQKGPVAQLLLRNGTLNIGDILVASNLYGKVKAIQNDSKNKILSVQSTALVDVLCFSQVPQVGSTFIVASNEKEAKVIIDKNKNTNISNLSSILNSRISIDDMKQKGANNRIKQINLILKAHTKGALDAIIYTLSKIPQEKVQINLLMATCGDVSFKDVDLAITSKSIILLFELNTTANVLQYAEQKNVAITKFDIIYDLIDYVQNYMLTFINIEYTKKVIGYAKVQSLFTINKGIVAGCLVQSGKLKKDAYFQIIKENSNNYIGSIDSLKRMKDDVDEVNEGNECGILCKDYDLWTLEDSLECYELKPLDKTL